MNNKEYKPFKTIKISNGISALAFIEQQTLDAMYKTKNDLNKTVNIYSKSMMPLNIQGTSDKIPGLLRSYMQKLMDDGKMYKLSEIKKMDILDTTGFLPPPDNGFGLPSFGKADEKERDILKRLGWYAIIPCFEKGAMKVNKFRYIVFEILEINPEEHSAKIALQDYMKSTDGVWQLSVGTTMIVKGTSIEEQHYVELKHENDLNFVKLYTMYDAKELNWTKTEYDIWQNTVVKNSEYVIEMFDRKHIPDQCEQLAHAFTLLITRCNAMLEMNKPSRPVNTKKLTKTSQKRIVTYEEDAAPKRKIRNVGALRVQSEKVPRKPCLETVITYKTAKWPVKGYTRHYKSGKTVYIGPGTRTRKALADTGQTTATTIRFKKKKEGN